MLEHTQGPHMFSLEAATHKQRHTIVSVTCTELDQGWKLLDALSVNRAPHPRALGSCNVDTFQETLHQSVTEGLRCDEALLPADIW